MNNKGFTFVEILAVIVIIGLLTGISIAAFSRYKENAIKNDYDALARSSYNAMEEYMMSHPYDDKVSLETLEDENLLSNRKDPGSKDTDCTGTVEVKKNAGTNGKIDDGEYKVHLCCVSIQKTYTYPGGKSTDLEDTSNCEYIPEDEPVVPPTPGTKYTLKYNDNNGTGCSTKSITRNAGEAWGSLCIPTRSGYTFKGWRNGSETVTASSVANGNITVVAQWSANTVKYTLRYSDNGGNGCSSKSITKNKNEAWGTLCSPRRIGYTFNGWYDGSTKYTSSTKAIKNVTVKANWTSNAAPKYTCSAGKYLPKNKTKCEICTSGNYCKGGTWSKNTVDQGLTPCPNGYKNSTTGSSKITQCYMNVVAGKFVKTAKATSATACGTGTYKVAHKVYYNSTSSCTQCPAGYRNGAGTTAQSNCIMNVTAGKYAKTAKSSTQTACGTGTYKGSHTVKYGSTSSCTNCPAGYRNGAGTTVQSNCIMNVTKNRYVKKSKASASTACAEGYYKAAHTVKYGSTSTCNPITVTINNSNNGKWVSWNYPITLTTNISADTVKGWYYSYKNISASASNIGTDSQNKWVYYSSSAGKKSFTTPKLSNEMNSNLYIMVCNKDNICTKSSTNVKIDKKAPTCTIVDSTDDGNSYNPNNYTWEECSTNHYLCPPKTNSVVNINVTCQEKGTYKSGINTYYKGTTDSNQYLRWGYAVDGVSVGEYPHYKFAEKPSGDEKKLILRLKVGNHSSGVENHCDSNKFIAVGFVICDNAGNCTWPWTSMIFQ